MYELERSQVFDDWLPPGHPPPWTRRLIGHQSMVRQQPALHWQLLPPDHSRLDWLRLQLPEDDYCLLRLDSPAVGSIQRDACKQSNQTHISISQIPLLPLNRSGLKECG